MRKPRQLRVAPRCPNLSDNVCTFKHPYNTFGDTLIYPHLGNSPMYFTFLCPWTEIFFFGGRREEASPLRKWVYISVKRHPDAHALFDLWGDGEVITGRRPGASSLTSEPWRIDLDSGAGKHPWAPAFPSDARILQCSHVTILRK